MKSMPPDQPASAAQTLKDSLWKAGKASLVEAAQPIGSLIGAAAFGATALTCVSMASLSGPLAAFLVVPAVIATASLACISLYKASRGFIEGLSDRTPKSDAQVKDALQKGFIGAGIGSLSAAGLAGAVSVIAALGPALGSNSLMVVPAYVGSIAAVGTVLASNIAGTIGLVSDSLLGGQKIATKIRERRQNVAEKPEPAGLKM